MEQHDDGDGWSEHRLHVEKSLERLERGQEKHDVVLVEQGKEITLIRIDVAELKARRRLLKSIASFFWGLIS